mmetsp:Transcript_31000/g.89329  ORF Transcript_31000/g.89329 Transcript_31000/m.89329 type:complete len:163 (-) Transcript_31000:31-519(-)
MALSARTHGGSTPRHHGGDPNVYLHDSKVGSSRGFVKVAGNIVAIPHKTSNTARLCTPRVRNKVQSEAMSAFREIPTCYASMEAKPLTPYDPLASRSRMPTDDLPIPYKNASSIEFRSKDACEKRRFVTTHQNEYVGRAPDMTTNQSINANNYTFHRSLRDK